MEKQPEGLSVSIPSWVIRHTREILSAAVLGMVLAVFAWLRGAPERWYILTFGIALAVAICAEVAASAYWKIHGGRKIKSWLAVSVPILVVSILICLIVVSPPSRFGVVETPQTPQRTEQVAPPVPAPSESVTPESKAEMAQPVQKKQERKELSAPAAVNPPTIRQESHGPNSPNIAGDDNIVTINPDANPNRLVVTYNCLGDFKRTVGPMPGIGFSSGVSFDDRTDYDSLAKLNDERNYTALLETCQEQMHSKPEWLTPYLFCGLAHAANGDNEKARKMLAYYDSKTGPSYSPECDRIAAFLRSTIKP